MPQTRSGPQGLPCDALGEKIQKKCPDGVKPKEQRGMKRKAFTDASNRISLHSAKGFQNARKPFVSPRKKPTRNKQKSILEDISNLNPGEDNTKSGRQEKKPKRAAAPNRRRSFSSKPARKCQNKKSTAFKMDATTITDSPPIVKSPLGRTGPGNPYALVHSPSHKGDPNVFLSGVSKYDQDNQKYVQHVANYSAEIFQYQFLNEKESWPRYYFQNQPHVTPRMRRTLVEWMFDVYAKFRLEPESHYLAVNIVDRYSSLEEIIVEEYQMVGVTAIFIATKYHEIYPPLVQDLVYLCDRLYTRQDILDMEDRMLKTLNFRISVAVGCPFVERFLSITKAGVLTCHASRYYMDRVLIEKYYLCRRPSLFAATAVLLSLCHPEINQYDFSEEAGATGKFESKAKLILEYTGFRKSEIIECAEIISSLVSSDSPKKNGRKAKLTTVCKIYSHEKFSHIATDFLPPEPEDLYNSW